MPDTLKPAKFIVADDGQQITIQAGDFTVSTTQIGEQTRIITAADGRVPMGTLTIRTPIPFLLDYARYATTREIEPAHPGAPDLEFTLDYALLAADLDACKWPDELIEAVAGLASEAKKSTNILAEIAEERNRQTSEWATALFNYDAKFLAVGLLSLNAAVNADTEEAHKVLMALRDDRVGDRERLIAGAAMLLRAIELITPS